MVTIHIRTWFIIGFALWLSMSVHAQMSQADRDLLRGFELKIEKGSFGEVERPLLDFVVSRPNGAEGFEMLARLRFRQQRLNEAQSLYEKALSLDPKLTRARIDLAVTLFYSGDPAGTVDQLKMVSRDRATASVHGLRLVEALILVRDFDLALKTVDLLPERQRNGRALPFRVEAYLRLGQKGNLLAIIPVARAMVRSDADAAIGVAGVLVGTEYNKQAGEIVSLVVASYPRNLRAILLLARSNIVAREFAAARTGVAKALDLAPDSAEAMFLLATIESENGSIAEGLKAIERALELAPGSVEIMSRAIVIAMRANKSRRAVEIGRQLIAIRPEEPDAIYLFGAASLQAGRIADAESYLERFLTMRPDDGRGCVAYSLSLAAQPDKIDAARRKLEGCVNSDSRNFEATYQLALSYRSSGETVRAIEYLERTVDVAPNYAYAVRDLGVLYLQAGNEAKARPALEKAAKLSPDDADTQFQLSRLYNLIGETELARRHFDRFQKLRDGNEN